MDSTEQLYSEVVAATRQLHSVLLQHARQGGKQKQRDGVAGYLWHGSLAKVLRDLNTTTPAGTNGRRVPGGWATMPVVTHLRNTRNAVCLRPGRGQMPSTWWIRAAWTDTVTAAPRTIPCDVPGCKFMAASTGGMRIHKAKAHPPSVAAGSELLARLQRAADEFLTAAGELEAWCHRVSTENDELKGHLTKAQKVFSTLPPVGDE